MVFTLLPKYKVLNDTNYKGLNNAYFETEISS